MDLPTRILPARTIVNNNSNNNNNIYRTKSHQNSDFPTDISLRDTSVRAAYNLYKKLLPAVTNMLHGHALHRGILALLSLSTSELAAFVHDKGKYGRWLNNIAHNLSRYEHPSGEHIFGFIKNEYGNDALFLLLSILQGECDEIMNLCTNEHMDRFCTDLLYVRSRAKTMRRRRARDCALDDGILLAHTLDRQECIDIVRPISIALEAPYLLAALMSEPDICLVGLRDSRLNQWMTQNIVQGLDKIPARAIDKSALEIVRDHYPAHAPVLVAHLVSLSFEELGNLDDLPDIHTLFDNLLASKCKERRQFEALSLRIETMGYRQRASQLSHLLMNRHKALALTADDSTLLCMVTDILFEIQATEAVEARRGQTTHGQLITHLRDVRPIPMNEAPTTEFNIMDSIPRTLGAIIYQKTLPTVAKTLPSPIHTSRRM